MKRRGQYPRSTEVDVGFGAGAGFGSGGGVVAVGVAAKVDWDNVAATFEALDVVEGSGFTVPGCPPLGW